MFGFPTKETIKPSLMGLEISELIISFLIFLIMFLFCSKTLLNIDSTKLVSYLNKFYHADNIIIVATGAVDHEKLHSLCEKYLSNLDRTDSPKTNIASYRPNEIREIRNIEQAHIIYAFEGCSYHDSQLYVSHVFSNILGGGMSSRLFQNIRENLGLAYSIFSFSSSYKDTGVFGIYSATSPDKVNDYSISVAQEIKNSGSSISEEEIQKAKKQIRAGLLISSENPSLASLNNSK